jgi:nucleoside-diphosphate-sugar epimerase
MGESLCLAHQNPSVRVARISNVIGMHTRAESAHNFLDAIIQEAVTQRRVVLHSSLQSEKDYIGINDVACSLHAIATGGRERIYNVARGANTSTAALLDLMREVMPFDVTVAAGAPSIVFPPIDVHRLEKEFGFVPQPIAPSVVASMKAVMSRGRHETSG